MSDATARILEEKIESLELTITKKDTEIENLKEEVAERDETIDELKSQINSLEDAYSKYSPQQILEKLK